MEDIIIYGYKNKYNYTINQLKINYKEKTFKLGQFTIKSDKNITRKAFNDKIEELKKCNFIEITEK